MVNAEKRRRTAVPKANKSSGSEAPARVEEAKVAASPSVGARLRYRFDLALSRGPLVVIGYLGLVMLAIANGGSIPDRGLFGVFLASEPGRTSRRVGELDEEMVFESRVGDVFVLGASSWRIEQITHDRVLVSPAPGEPGKLPFWRGDGPGRPLAFGRAIGAMVREIGGMSPGTAEATLVAQHRLDPAAARNLIEKSRRAAMPLSSARRHQACRSRVSCSRDCEVLSHS